MRKLITMVVVMFCFTTAFGQMSIAHIDSQKILDTMPSRKAAMKEFMQFEEKMFKELQETQTKLQAEVKEFNERGSELSATGRRFEEERLGRKYQEFQMRQQEIEQQLQQMSVEMNEPILARIQKAIEAVCKTEKIDYVIDESALLYAKGRDITDKVIKEVLRMEAEEAKK
jgi:outer membrane protein